MFLRNDQSYGITAQRYAQHCSDVYSTKQLGVALDYLQSDSEDDTDGIGVANASKLQTWNWDPANKKSVGEGLEKGKPTKMQKDLARNAMIRLYMEYNFKEEYQQKNKSSTDTGVNRAYQEAYAVIPEYTVNGAIKKEGSARPKDEEIYNNFSNALARYNEFLLSLDPDVLYSQEGDDAVAERRRQLEAKAEAAAKAAAEKARASFQVKEQMKERATLKRLQDAQERETEKKRAKVIQNFMKAQKELLFAQDELRRVGGDPKDYGEQSAQYEEYITKSQPHPASTTAQPVSDPAAFFDIDQPPAAVAASSSGLHHPEPVTFAPELVNIANAVATELARPSLGGKQNETVYLSLYDKLYNAAKVGLQIFLYTHARAPESVLHDVAKTAAKEAQQRGFEIEYIEAQGREEFIGYVPKMT
jgi:hypothetical protein